MALLIGFVIALLLALLAAEDGWLGQDSERAWVNHLADQSRRDRKRGRIQKYSKAGYWY